MNHLFNLLFSDGFRSSLLSQVEIERLWYCDTVLALLASRTFGIVTSSQFSVSKVFFVERPTNSPTFGRLSALPPARGASIIISELVGALGCADFWITGVATPIFPIDVIILILFLIIVIIEEALTVILVSEKQSLS